MSTGIRFVSRDSTRYAIVALLGGSAIALAAATFPTTSASEGPPIPGGSNGLGSFSLPVPEESPSSSFEVPSTFAEVFGVVMFVATAVAVAYAVYNWRKGLNWFLQGAALALVVSIFFYVAMQFPDGLFDQGEFGLGDDDTRGGGEEVFGSESLVSTDPSSLVVVAFLLAGLLVVGLTVLHRRDGGTEHAGRSDDEPVTTAAVGRAAGRAADRIETADEADNEIYRTWAEMARLVDASDPETRTSGEFADAAIDVGMDPDDVRDLTRLFERVRYGTDEPTDDDEQRAVDLFRRIEATYAEES